MLSLRATKRLLFFFNDTATTEIYTLSLHDALPISHPGTANHSKGSKYGRSEGRQMVPAKKWAKSAWSSGTATTPARSEEHTSELQSQSNLVCRLLLEKKNNESRVPLLFRLPVHELA